MPEDLNVGRRRRSRRRDRLNREDLRPGALACGASRLYFEGFRVANPGGYTAYKVRTSVDRVESVVDRLDILIALTERTVDENLDELHEGSIVIYDGERSMMSDFEAPAR